MSNPISTTTLDHQISAAKRPSHHQDDAADHLHQPLLTGIPDHLSHICLSLVPPSKLYAVCSSWRRLIWSPSFPPFPSLYALLLPADNLHQHHLLLNSPQFASFDPISAKWQPLPPPPPDWRLRFLFRHPSFISRRIPVQSVAVAGKLVVLAATNDEFLPALSQPMIFDPLSGNWTLGPPLAAPRRWCASGACCGAVFVASGVGSQYNTGVARSVEKWDVDSLRHRRRWNWQKMRNLKDGKFSRDAIDGVGWRGKLCMVNVSGGATKEGIIYDIEKDSWGEMPEGMLAGWRGPAAAMDEETIYAVDESKGLLKKYDHAKDVWAHLMVDERLKGVHHLAAAGGKVCGSAADGSTIVVVDVAAPPGFQVSALHILPRLSNNAT
ncbi:F-box/kelch-repeat protein SKIP25-like isoform X2 [Salvia splendens]|uniref:F-box/kelch-repeat protein SKIP25-like isoform X2 n=1 Tax=Salvia splendens TaxID=180675 RepID=UPI001C2677F1|nr:F-box/kelch-repeat protein SKIP25-like isoform X2 [Salvia splendens]